MGKLQQAHTAISCSAGNMLTGMLFVWPSYTLRLYTIKDTVHLNSPMTEIESSLVGSLPPLGAMVGTFSIGWLLNNFGRKKAGLILAFPMLISWLMISLTKSSVVILIARFLGGVAGGGFMGHAPIYISEVAEESIRGTLTSAPMTFYCIGVLTSYLLGWFLSYRYIIWSNVICCIVYAGLIMTVTESPVYLIGNNRDEEARRSIAHYRGGSVSSKRVLEEFSRLKEQVMPATELLAIDSDVGEKEKLNSEANGIVEQSLDNKISSFKMLFVSSASRRAFTVVGLALSVQVLMGMVAVQVYAKDIFTKAAPKLSSHFCSAMFASILLLGSLVVGIFADKCGRKMLLISSAIATGLCLVSMGAIIQTNIAPAWVTAPMILFYCFAFMFGSGSVPYVLLAEVFTPEVQSFASILLLELVWLLNFFIIGIFPFMVKFLGIHGSFYCFAVFSLLDCLVGFFFLPETKGLTNEQIQEVLMGIVAVQVYAKDIFTKAAPHLSSHFCSAMLASILLLGSLIVGIFADRYGRKMLLISSAIATGLCLVSMGAIIQTNIAPAWVTAPMILFYCFAFMFGSGSIPYVLLAEAFTPECEEPYILEGNLVKIHTY